MPALVILSEAKNLIISGIYAFEILRLTPQNDVVGQLLGEILLTDTAFILAQALLSESPPMGAPPFRVGSQNKATGCAGGFFTRKTTYDNYLPQT